MSQDFKTRRLIISSEIEALQAIENDSNLSPEERAKAKSKIIEKLKELNALLDEALKARLGHE